MSLLSELGGVRAGLGRALFGLVAGPDGPNNRARIHNTPGPRWFDEDRPIRRVHADASMFVGGLRALLFQSLHPLAMAGVAEHSDYRGDPWGRLQRTSTFLAVTTFGPADDAQRAVDKVRGIHRRVHGVAPDGTPYDASDPHLLEWVHIAEVDSFLLAHQRYGAVPLDQAGRDGYVADAARVAERSGRSRPATHRTTTAATHLRIPSRVARDGSGAGCCPVSALDAAAAARRTRTLRRPRCDIGRDATGVGAHTAVAAVRSAGRGHRHQDGRQRRCRRDPMGDDDRTART